MLAKDTICAEMAFMLMERNRPGSTIDYPMGGTSSIVDALRRGIEKNGGKIMLRSHVEEILVAGDAAVVHMHVHVGAIWELWITHCMTYIMRATVPQIYIYI